MKKFNKKFIKECEAKLLKIRNYYTKVITSAYKKYDAKEDSEVSIVKQASTTSHFIRNKMLKSLPEIEHALRKIKLGTYGICELSGETIELKRLKAVPWTRVQINSAHA